MSFYRNSLAKILQEKIAYFKNAGFLKEAQLLQTRLNNLENKQTETSVEVFLQNNFQNPIMEKACENLKVKLERGTKRFPELEKQFILENLHKVKTLKELEPLRISYINRMLKIIRAASGKNIDMSSFETYSGPYNNEKTFCEVLRLIYSQDPVWLEDFKELYFSIMPQSLTQRTL